MKDEYLIIPTYVLNILKNTMQMAIYITITLNNGQNEASVAITL